MNTTAPSKNSRRGLGRGLAALIPESDFDLLSGVARGDVAPLPVQPAPTTSPRAKSTLAETTPDPAPGDVRYLPISALEANPFQPRQVFSEEELENLAASLREHGVLQPVLVRPIEGERFQLIAGERRWRAAKRAGLEQIPAIVRVVDDRNALELAIIENVQRHDISSVESAQAYRRLSREFGLSQEQVAARVGKSRVAVANTMRLLDLPTEALDALREGKISEGHGRALLTASGEPARRALLRRVLRDALTVRDVERLAREGADELPAPRLQRVSDADVTRLETTLQRAVGMRLKLRPRRRGGQLVIDYSSPEELQRLVKRLTGSEV